MSDYIKDAIITGVWETFVMTFFASLFSYIIGMPLGVLLYSTSRGRLLENRPVNFVLGAFAAVSYPAGPADPVHKIPGRTVNRNDSSDRAADNRRDTDRREDGRIIS